MTSRERILTTCAHRTPDKLPVDFGGGFQTGIHVSIVHKLRQALGLDRPGTPVKVVEIYQMLGEIAPDLRDALGIDTVSLHGTGTMFGFPQKEFKEWQLADGTPVLVPKDFNTQYEPNGDLLQWPGGDHSVPPSGRMPAGGHFFDAIIRQAPIDEAALNPADNTEEFQMVPDDELAHYARLADHLFSTTDKALFCAFGGLTFGDIALVPATFLKRPRGIRDIEEWYISTVARRDYIQAVFERQTEVALKNLARLHAAIGNRAAIIQTNGTDFGTQNGPFCSPAKYRELYLPYQKRINSWIHRHTNWKTFMHCCGGIEPLLDCVVEAEFDILNPVQCSARGMEARTLKQRFGDRLVFWGGGVDTQHTLPFGTTQAVRDQVRERIEVFAPGGGFVFCTIHNIQANTPIENVLTKPPINMKPLTAVPTLNLVTDSSIDAVLAPSSSTNRKVGRATRCAPSELSEVNGGAQGVPRPTTALGLGARIAGVGLWVFILFLAIAAPAAETLWLHSLDLSKMRQHYGKPQVDRSIRGKPLSIAGQQFQHGIGTHANSSLWIDLAGCGERFSASVGIDDSAAGAGSIAFKVLGDGRKLFDSGVMKTGNAARTVDLDVRGVKTLLLQVTDANDGVNFDHADWADARLLFTGTKPQAIDRPVPHEAAVILTPKPGPSPRINGPTVYGSRPGNPFLFRIPTQGERPITFSAKGLPRGFKLDANTGIITGTTPARGKYSVTLHAKNRHGEAQRAFQIVSGDTLALTPPMGWNHWYAHYNRVTDRMMREAADVMISSGMADVGYEYVNIDDCWMNAASDARHNADPARVGPFRDAQGNILPNRHFPNMKALTDYIHAKGLKAGIYTSPGPLTCAGFAGAYLHEAQDARQFADWGFDFLKYDWCSYGQVVKGDKSLKTLVLPYILMGDLLKQQKRDLVFNLCQYGMGDVWEWGAEVGGHCWRTAGDLGFELDRIFEVALKNAEHRAHSRPGSWNDPDYIQIGFIGSARGLGEPRPCPLTPSEQYSFMSLWCLMAAPLVYSGDMSKLDDFTLNVLCNPEVIEVDLDPLGQSARVIPLTDDTFAMVKDLEDGSKAVGFFNHSELETTVGASWSQLGLTGRQRLRDLWRQKDMGTFDSEFKASIPRHGGVLVRTQAIKPPK